VLKHGLAYQKGVLLKHSPFLQDLVTLLQGNMAYYYHDKVEISAFVTDAADLL